MLLTALEAKLQMNAVMFQEAAPFLPLLKIHRDDAILWRGRFPAELQPTLDA
jgi:hypothetical protein